MSYKTQNQFIYSKANLKDRTKFKDAFIVKNLTPLRAKLFNYVKKECNDEFVLCHTYKGKVRMKKSAKQQAGKLNPNEVDKKIAIGLL